jgi:hypothetical protein
MSCISRRFRPWSAVEAHRPLVAAAHATATIPFRAVEDPHDQLKSISLGKKRRILLSKQTEERAQICQMV